MLRTGVSVKRLTMWPEYSNGADRDSAEYKIVRIPDPICEKYRYGWLEAPEALVSVLCQVAKTRMPTVLFTTEPAAKKMGSTNVCAYASPEL
jgi:hypothetical protein